MSFSQELIDCIQRALDEDVGIGDVTSEPILPQTAALKAQLVAKQVGIIAGLDVAAQAFTLVDGAIEFVPCFQDGDRVIVGDVIARISGPARAILVAERTALNFFGRMSGIATLTRKYVDAVSGTGAVILDTRKTVPGLRQIDKLAVRAGGGQNHRMGLYDMVLIKDNHIDFAGSLPEAVRRVRRAQSGLEIEVETRTLEDLALALDLGVERIMLDNMSLAQMREAVAITGGRARLEASGNVDLSRVRQIAETGVDFISIGALTHSVPVFDASLRDVERLA